MLKPVILLAALAALPAAARAPGDVIMPTDPAALAQQTQYGYAEAVVAGDTIYLSGVVAGPIAGEKGCNRRMNAPLPISPGSCSAPVRAGTMSST